MNVTVHPAKTLHGSLRVPGDRSITVRAVLLGSIASGTSHVRGALECDDTAAAIASMRKLGVAIDPVRDMASSDSPNALRISGVGLRGLRTTVSPTLLFCSSSGTTMRLLAGLMAGQSFPSTLDGSAQLRARPMRRITDPLNAMGACIASVDGCAPLSIMPGALHGIDYAMPVASAQVKSALLLAALYADGEVVIHEPAPTRDHTERMLEAMGVGIGGRKSEVASQHEDDSGKSVYIGQPRSMELRPLEMSVPADFSSAAFWLVAGAIHPAAHIELTHAGLNPTRTGLLTALRAMGAQIEIANTMDQGGEPVGDVCVKFSDLHAIDVGGGLTSLMIDEFPVFAVAATQATGTTLIRDAQELRVKESNRIDGLVEELRKMGAAIEATPDGFTVDGPTRLHGAVVDAHGDHRIAMALAVAGLIADGETTIAGAECVNKTYPRFFADLTAVSQQAGER